MKTRTMLSLLAVAALAMTATALWAQEEGPPAGPPPPRPKMGPRHGPGGPGGGPPGRGGRPLPPEVREKILAEFDKDGDGQLNEEERQAAREAREARMKAQREKILAEFDKDGDGQLNEEGRTPQG